MLLRRAVLPILALAVEGAETQQDCEAIYTAYQAFSGADWNSNAGWPASVEEVTPNCCRWDRITCFDGNVRVVNLWQNGLSGEIPEGLLSGLASVERVYLSQNDLSGAIPEGLFSGLTTLRTVSMNDNRLSGQLPGGLFSGLDQLSEVALQNNLLAGEVPSNLFEGLPRLLQVLLHNTALHGTLPTHLCELNTQGENTSQPHVGDGKELFMYDSEHTCCTPVAAADQACPSMNACCAGEQVCVGAGYCCQENETVNVFGDCVACSAGSCSSEDSLPEPVEPPVPGPSELPPQQELMMTRVATVIIGETSDTFTLGEQGSFVTAVETMSGVSLYQNHLFVEDVETSELADLMPTRRRQLVAGSIAVQASYDLQVTSDAEVAAAMELISDGEALFAAYQAQLEADGIPPAWNTAESMSSFILPPDAGAGGGSNRLTRVALIVGPVLAGLAMVLVITYALRVRRGKQKAREIIARGEQNKASVDNKPAGDEVLESGLGAAERPQAPFSGVCSREPVTDASEESSAARPDTYRSQPGEEYMSQPLSQPMSEPSGNSLPISQDLHHLARQPAHAGPFRATSAFFRPHNSGQRATAGNTNSRMAVRGESSEGRGLFVRGFSSGSVGSGRQHSSQRLTAANGRMAGHGESNEGRGLFARGFSSNSVGSGRQRSSRASSATAPAGRGFDLVALQRDSYRSSTSSEAPSLDPSATNFVLTAGMLRVAGILERLMVMRVPEVLEKPFEEVTNLLSCTLGNMSRVFRTAADDQLMVRWSEQCVSQLERVGTLIQGKSVDGACFLPALRDVYYVLVRVSQVVDASPPGCSWVDPTLQSACIDLSRALTMCSRELDASASKCEIPRSDLIIAEPSMAEGGYSRIYRCTYRHHDAVAKVFSVARGGEEASFWNELSHLKSMHHERIIHMFGATRLYMNGVDSMALVMEFMAGGSLSNFIHHHPEKLVTEMTKRLALDVAYAMEHVHACGIQHRDLKPANVLLSTEKGELRAKVADFGISKEDNNDTTVQSLRGFSPEWSAPEVVRGVFGEQGNTKRTLASDVYSFAVMLWEMTAKKAPWGELLSQAEARRRSFAIAMCVLQGNRPKMPEVAQEGLAALIEEGWQDEPMERPSFKTIRAGLEQGHWRGLPLFPQSLAYGSDSGVAAVNSRATSSVLNDHSGVINRLLGLLTELAQLFAGDSVNNENYLELTRWVDELQARLHGLKTHFEPLDNTNASTSSHNLEVLQQLEAAIESLVEKTEGFAERAQLPEFILPQTFQDYLSAADQAVKEAFDALDLGGPSDLASRACDVEVAK
ncbi:unnamed protein product [Chrysoparadoxa australica]